MYSSQLQLKFSNVSEAKIAAQSLCELLKSRISVFDFHGLQVTVGKDGDLSISVRFQDVKAMNDFEKDIPIDDINNSKTIGISSGASAPEQLVQNLLSKIKKDRDVTIEEVVVAEEKVIFKLPKQLN